jgi:uncharacterized membrane protein (DUF485 family)
MEFLNRETMSSASWKRFRFHLRREFLLQLDGRRSYSRGVYPGVSWFALLCVAVLLLEFNSSRLSPEQSRSAVDNFTLLALGQCILVWLRATVYCALSFSRDLQNQSVTVVRITPVSRTMTLLAKLCASLAPLWMELLLFLPVSILFFSVYLSLPVLLVFSLTPFLLCLSLAAGCLGLAVGSLSVQPAHAIRNARLLTFFLLFFIPILKQMSSSWFLPMMGLALWLLVYSRRAPNRGVFILTSASVAFALALVNIFQPLGLNVSKLHPTRMIMEFYPEAFSHRPWELPTSLVMESLSYPVGVAGVYLVVAAVFFWLARLRFSYS